MALTHIPFDDSYRPAYRQVSRAVRAEGAIFTCGQLDADGEGRILHPADLAAQTRRSLALLDDIIERSGGRAEDLLHLQVFYRHHRALDVPAYADWLRSLLPAEAAPVTVLTPLARFPKGIEVEVDAVAAVGVAERGRVARAEAGNGSAVRRGGLLFAAASAPGRGGEAGEALVATLQECLSGVGSALSAACKVRVYASRLSPEPDEGEARIAEAFAPIRPVYTRLPLFSPAEQREMHIEVVGVCDERGAALPRSEFSAEASLAAPWPLPYAPALQCGRFVFVGGTLPTEARGEVRHPGELSAQVPVVMERVVASLAGFGLSMADVAKVNAYYVGPMDLPTWTRNVQARCECYPQPGPASTGVEVTTLGRDGATAAVDCIAVASPRS